MCSATGGLLLLLLIYFQSATVFTHALTGALAIRRAATNCDCAYQVPAPSPIEQRWTSASSSFLSPGYSANPDTVLTWVGIIMYMPPGQDEAARVRHCVTTAPPSLFCCASVWGCATRLLPALSVLANTYRR